jgi:cleavage stimulation factor subunit 3
MYTLHFIAEDNNTRVLFERVLSSGSLEPEKSVYVQDFNLTFIWNFNFILQIIYYLIKYILYRDIWNRFLEFESNIGDLASIVKVEKRRSAVLEKVVICLSMIYYILREIIYNYI